MEIFESNLFTNNLILLGYQLLNSLSDRKFEEDEIIQHVHLNNHDTIILTNHNLIALKKQGFLTAHLTLDWYEPWKNFHEAIAVKNKIFIKLKVLFFFYYYYYYNPLLFTLFKYYHHHHHYICIVHSKFNYVFDNF